MEALMTRIAITEGELLDALTTATRGAAPDDALTVREMAEATGASTKRVQQTLQRLQREGRLTIHHVERIRIDGLRTLVPAYTIAPLKKPTRKRA